jgi:hypothetical protein
MAKKSTARSENKGHSSKEGSARKSGREARSDDSGGSRQKSQGKKLTQGNKIMDDGFKRMAGGKKSKDGCFPKLFILALPFMAVGAYFSLGS